MVQKYDEAIEQKFFDLCQLDEHPVISIDPVMASTYLGVKLHTSEEGFQQIIETEYKLYTIYLDQFIQQNSVEIDCQDYLRVTISRLLSKYQNLSTQFKDSSIRLGWKMRSSSLPQNSVIILNILKQEYYNGQANLFFYKMATVQRLFIKRMIKYLKQQKSSFSHIPNVILTQSNSPQYLNKQSNTLDQTSKLCDIQYLPRFKLNQKNKNSIDILGYIYDKLKDDYMSCKKGEFIKLFSNPDVTFAPVVWKKDYIHLSYIIKRLTKDVILKQTNPSHYEIATKVFWNKMQGVPFNIARPRHNHGPEKNEKDKIDGIFNAINVNFFPLSVTSSANNMNK